MVGVKVVDAAKQALAASRQEDKESVMGILSVVINENAKWRDMKAATLEWRTTAEEDGTAASRAPVCLQNSQL